MQITNVKVTPVNIPLETPFYWTGGYYPGTSKVIIEVHAEHGPMDHFYNPEHPGNFKRLPLN